MTTDITTGTETSDITGAPVEPDSTRVQQVDPSTLIMDANVRHDARPDRAMIASVRDHGVLQPIIAVATGDGRARVRFGHRRTRAAIAAECVTVPVIVHPSNADADDAADEIDRIAKQSVENSHRRGLSPTEQMDAFADMAAFGLTAGQIAARTKTRRRDVVHGLRAARVPEVREAVQSAGLTLEQAAALEEFSDQPEHYELLLDRATNPRGWGPGFEHTVQQLRDRRDEAAARDALLAELADAGIPVVDQPMYGGATKRLIDLTHDPEPATDGAGDRAPTVGPEVAQDDDGEGPEFGDEDDCEEDEREDGEDDCEPAGSPGAVPAPITPEAHATCPGHAAYLTSTYGGPQRQSQVVAVYVCTDPLGHGHRSRTGAPLRHPSGPAAARSGETSEEAEDREAAEKAAKAAARRRVIAGNKAWDSATTVRRGWLASLLTRRTPPTGASTWMAQAFLTDRYTVCRAAERGHRTAAELLCSTPATLGQADHERVLTALAGASENRATVITLGMVLGAIEGETHRSQWRWKEHHGGRPDAGLVRYLEALAGWGYTLSPVERLAIGEHVDDAEVFEAPGALASTGTIERDNGDPDDEDSPAEDSGADDASGDGEG